MTQLVTDSQLTDSQVTDSQLTDSQLIAHGLAAHRLTAHCREQHNGGSHTERKQMLRESSRDELDRKPAGNKIKAELKTHRINYR